MFRKVLAAAIALSFSAPLPLKAQVTSEGRQLLLLRHAEKEAAGANPGLSAAGKQRAGQLATLLSEVPVTRLYATNYRRTQQTLQPLAEKKHLEISGYEPGAQEAFAQQLKSSQDLYTVVAGHSNTVPALVNLLLGSERYTDLAENEYGMMWLLTLVGDQVVSCTVFNTN